MERDKMIRQVRNGINVIYFVRVDALSGEK